MFTAMLPGELASSAGNYDGIQTANLMNNSEFKQATFLTARTA